jgi:hypothetical protein
MANGYIAFYNGKQTEVRAESSYKAQVEAARIGTKGPNGWDYDKGYGSVRLTGEDSVQIELRSLPIETAIRVLRAIQGDK